MWPIPFYGRFQTSPFGTVVEAHEESLPRDTEEVCPYSGHVGRSHTIRAGRATSPEKIGMRWKENRMKEKKNYYYGYD